MMKLATCLTAVVVASVLASAACDKGGGKTDIATLTSADSTQGAGAVKGSCNMLAQMGTCTEYTADDGLSLDKSLCEGFKGTFTSAACPTAALVGSCAMSEGETKRYYVTKDELSSFTVEESKADCESDLVKGKFTVAAGAATRGPTAQNNVQNTPNGATAADPANVISPTKPAKTAAKPATAKAH